MLTNEQKVARFKCQKSLLFFTRYFFKKQYGRKFVVNEHHEQITTALERVVNGEIKRLIINIAPRYGKAIDCLTPMLTTQGWKEASEVMEGDYLFSRDGNPTKVIGVYPQGITDAYKVTFSDGSCLVTCGDHLWALNHKDLSRKDNFKFKQIKKTRELIGTLKAKDGHKMWQIPTTSGIVRPRKKLPIDPYLLGCWLGDGSSYKAEITTMDSEIVSAFEAQYPLTVRTHQNSGKATTYGIRGGFITKLKQLGLLGNKRIPDDYLLSSKNQRLELLRGICDTDGTCNRLNGQTSICSTKKALRDDIRLLAESLGGHCTVYKSSVFIRLKSCPFNLPRKKRLWRGINHRHFTKRFIVSIDKVSDRQTVCFAVDAKDHLFLAGKNLIVTHNTEIAVKNLIAYGLALNPSAKFIHLSYADTLALDNSDSIRNVISSDDYKALFPEVQIKPKSDAKDRWYTTAGGGVLARAAAGQVTGFGAGQVDDDDAYPDGSQSKFAGAIIIDDPIKPEDADSDQIRAKINERFDSTIRSRTNSRNTPIIVIMQRLHPLDLAGYLQRDDEPDKWHVLSLPAIKPNGEALWPFKHSLEELNALRQANMVVFERQYMQNPLVGAFEIFKKEWFKTGLTSEPTATYAAIDPAIGQDQTHDESAICVMQTSYGDPIPIYETETIAGHWDFDTTIKMIKMVNDKYKPSMIGIEDVGYQKALIQECARLGLPVIAIKAIKDKVARATSITHLMSQGRVFVNDLDLKKQLVAFRGQNERNDRVDAFVHCLTMIRDYTQIKNEKPDDPLAKMDPVSARFWAMEKMERMRQEAEENYQNDNLDIYQNDNLLDNGEDY